MENSVCVNYKENLKCLVRVANVGPFVRKPLPPWPPPCSFAFIFRTVVKLRELKPIRVPLLFQGYSRFSWCRPASTLTARTPESSTPIFSFKILKLFFSFSTTVFKLAGMWVSEKGPASQTDGRRQVKRFEADFQLFPLTFLFRLFRIHLLLQITSAGHGHSYVCVFCLFCVSAAPLCLWRSSVKRKNSDSPAKPPTVT